MLRWLLLLVFLASPLAAQCDPLSFADQLAAEGDHYRAITEYKRFLHDHPTDPRASRARLAIALSLLAGERWGQADKALETVWTKHPRSPQAHRARRLHAAAAYQREDYLTARDRYRELAQNSSEASAARALAGLSSLRRDDPAAAAEDFSAAPLLRRVDLLQGLAEYQALPRKSPQLAGTLSALLPGAGQLYTERPRQAGIAFALNTVFIYGAVEAWDNDNHALAALLGLVELGWYGGNIYNAMNNAHQFNRRTQHNFLDRLEQRFNLAPRKSSTLQLQLQMRF